MLTRALMVNGSRLRVALACLVCAASVWLAGASQNSHTGPVTGVIDGVGFEGDQYYVHGWACQEGNRGSIEVHIYANHPAGGTPPGTHALAGPGDVDKGTGDN